MPRKKPSVHESDAKKLQPPSKWRKLFGRHQTTNERQRKSRIDGEEDSEDLGSADFAPSSDISVDQHAALISKDLATAKSTRTVELEPKPTKVISKTAQTVPRSRTMEETATTSLDNKKQSTTFSPTYFPTPPVSPGLKSEKERLRTVATKAEKEKLTKTKGDTGGASTDGGGKRGEKHRRHHHHEETTTPKLATLKTTPSIEASGGVVHGHGHEVKPRFPSKAIVLPLKEADVKLRTSDHHQQHHAVQSPQRAAVHHQQHQEAKKLSTDQHRPDHHQQKEPFFVSVLNRGGGGTGGGGGSGAHSELSFTCQKTGSTESPERTERSSSEVVNLDRYEKVGGRTAKEEILRKAIPSSEAPSLKELSDRDEEDSWLTRSHRARKHRKKKKKGSKDRRRCCACFSKKSSSASSRFRNRVIVISVVVIVSSLIVALCIGIGIFAITKHNHEKEHKK